MIIGKTLKTEFAPPERLHQDAVFVQYKEILTDDKFCLFYDFSADFVLVLNEYRQTIFSNKTLLDFLGKNDVKEIIGQRPGEILNCKESCALGGCGTSKFCRECGAAKAILATTHNCTQMKECYIQTADGKNSYNFRVWSAFPWNDKNYMLFIIRDIADEKFRNAMEQTFFHDLTNTASDIQALLSLINSPENYKKYAHLLSSVSWKLLETINWQRDLRYAEEGTILIKKSSVNALNSITSFIELYKNQEIAEGIKLVVSGDSEDIIFSSDKHLLLRILENMIKNAIEASHKGQTVSIGCKKNGNNVVFSVHNPNFIEENIQLNIFKRSFSTKGMGRGWGTYSMKLLTERYLDGHVSFSSTKESGTTFYAEYPLL